MIDELLVFLFCRDDGEWWGKIPWVRLDARTFPAIIDAQRTAVRASASSRRTAPAAFTCSS